MMIEPFLATYDFDLRKSGDARFMDQKVTPDVLSIIADCILQYVGSDYGKEFTTKDIWESEYSNQNVKDIFNKPAVMNATARSEYDKFFAQPMKMLAYAQVLKCVKRGGRNRFMVQEIQLLTYIAVKEKNALNFIVVYLEKVLVDSGLWKIFCDFFIKNDSHHYYILKNGFQQFLYTYTNINETNHYEPSRIFTKIINPLAFARKKHGTKSGRISSDVIGYDELLYNRKNWRDVKKNRSETRSEYEERARKVVMARRNAMTQFTMEKAKRIIRFRYKGVSEVQDDLAVGVATQVHHIFSRNEFPMLESYTENLILLTATQHVTRAHPNNETHTINKDYQLICLLAKSKNIEISVNACEGIYSKEDFVYVLNAGLNPIEFDVQSSYSEIQNQLSNAYNEA